MTNWKGKGSKSARLWATRRVVIISAALIYHMAAVLAGALAAAPSSALEQVAYTRLFLIYCNMVNQGYSYRFYARLEQPVAGESAPRPWSTPVLLAELEGGSLGDGPRLARLPERGLWPRLRLQRELALVYHLRIDPRWGSSYARHLCRATGCERVRLSIQEHQIPDLAAVTRSVVEGKVGPHWDDASTYGERQLIGEFRWGEF